MQTKRIRAWLQAVLGTGLILGCQATGGRPPFPDDPLLLSKKPVAGKAAPDGPVLTARNEPLAPSLPATALAGKPGDGRSLVPAAGPGNLRLPANPWGVGTTAPGRAPSRPAGPGPLGTSSGEAPPKSPVEAAAEGPALGLQPRPEAPDASRPAAIIVPALPPAPAAAPNPAGASSTLAPAEDARPPLRPDKTEGSPLTGMVPPVDPARQTAAAPPLVVPVAAALPPVAAALAPKPAEPLPPVTPAAPAPPRIPLPPVAEAAPAKPADPGPVIPAWAPESPPSKPADPGPPSAPALAPATGPDLAASDKAGAPGPRQPVQGTHGHAADYTWLQGILDKHYLGHLNLRYCDCTVEDTWGGKVRLLDDPRLAQLKEGDVVFVEGELVRDQAQAPGSTWKQYPTYRVREVQLVQRKN